MLVDEDDEETIEKKRIAVSRQWLFTATYVPTHAFVFCFSGCTLHSKKMQVATARTQINAFGALGKKRIAAEPTAGVEEELLMKNTGYRCNRMTYSSMPW